MRCYCPVDIFADRHDFNIYAAIERAVLLNHGDKLGGSFVCKGVWYAHAEFKPAHLITHRGNFARINGRIALQRILFNQCVKAVLRRRVIVEIEHILALHIFYIRVAVLSKNSCAVRAEHKRKIVNPFLTVCLKKIDKRKDDFVALLLLFGRREKRRFKYNRIDLLVCDKRVTVAVEDFTSGRIDFNRF